MLWVALTLGVKKSIRRCRSTEDREFNPTNISLEVARPLGKYFYQNLRSPDIQTAPILSSPEGGHDPAILL